MTGFWQPANDTEEAMVKALRDGDHTRYFRVVATAELYLPSVTSTAGDREADLITGTTAGRKFLPAFASVEALIEAVGDIADGYNIVTYARLRATWPEPEWLLGINAGSPIEAYLPVDAVARGALGELQLPDPDVTIAVPPVDRDRDRVLPYDPHATMRAAAARGDTVMQLDALLDARVLVPTERVVTEPANEWIRPGFPFPWRPVYRAGVPTIEVFTAEEEFDAAHPAEPRVSMPFPMLQMIFPPEYDLSVNPGHPDHLTVPGDQVRTLRPPE